LPSATNIEEYDDPLLDEVSDFSRNILKKNQFQIFADTNSDSKILPQKQINTAATLVNSQANSAAIRAAKQQHQQSSIFSGELERMSSAPSSSAAAAAVAEGTKNVIDPNAKPLPGSVFTNPGMNPFPNILSKLDGAHSDGTASAGPTLGLDSQNNGAAAFAGPLTDWAFQAGQTFYTGVRHVPIFWLGYEKVVIILSLLLY
jgi:hypothetical protein